MFQSADCMFASFARWNNDNIKNNYNNKIDKIENNNNDNNNNQFHIWLSKFVASKNIHVKIFSVKI